jgi:hypothetical protein
MSRSGFPLHRRLDAGPRLFQLHHPDGAVQAAVLDVLQHTEAIGGALLMKRAHQNSSSSHVPTPLAADPAETWGQPAA